jgi:hypothetical protein
MNAFETAVKFFQDCGLFIYPSLLIMSMGLAIAIERWVFLRRARLPTASSGPDAADAAEWQFKEVLGMAAEVPTRRSARSSPTACSACRAPAGAKTSTPRWRKA